MADNEKTTITTPCLDQRDAHHDVQVDHGMKSKRNQEVWTTIIITLWHLSKIIKDQISHPTPNQLYIIYKDDDKSNFSKDSISQSSEDYISTLVANLSDATDWVSL